MNYSNNNIFRTGMLWVMVLTAGLLGGCEKLKISDDLAGFDPEGDLPQFALVVSGPGLLSGDRLVDVGEAKTYNHTVSAEHPELIDFATFWGASTGMNFVSPIDIPRMNAWGSGQTINETFMVKNATNFVKLNPTEENLKLYDDITHSAQVKAAYEHALSIVEDEEGYIENQYGPGVSIRQIQAGDLIFFHTSKNIYAAAKVLSMTTGNSGRIELALKLDLRDKQVVEPVAADQVLDTYETAVTRPYYLNGQRYLDASTGETFDISSLTPWANQAFQNQEKIDIVLLNSSTSGYNLIVPTDADRLNGWSGGRAITNDWLDKNDGQLVKVSAGAKADSIFLYTYTRTKLHEAYNNVLENVEDLNGDVYNQLNHGPGGHISDMQDGDLFFFKSESKNILAMFKVTAHTSGNAGQLALSARVDNTEKIDVPRNPLRLNINDLTVGGWSALGPEGATYHVDLASITRHDVASADANMEHIDMLNLWSGSGFVNFMTPTSAVTAWGSSARIADWPVRNLGVFVHLEDPTADEITTFESLTDRVGLVQAFEDAQANIESRTGYDAGRHGPSIRVRYMQPGSIVYFKSEAPGRNLYAAIEVKDVVTGSSNGREVVTIFVKSNLLSDD